MLPNSEKDFLKRHIGPTKEDQLKMLKELNYKSLDDLINNTVPEKIKFKGELNIGESNSEYEALRKLRVMSKKNQEVLNILFIIYGSNGLRIYELIIIPFFYNFPNNTRITIGNSIWYYCKCFYTC